MRIKRILLGSLALTILFLGWLCLYRVQWPRGETDVGNEFRVVYYCAILPPSAHERGRAALFYKGRLICRSIAFIGDQPYSLAPDRSRVLYIGAVKNAGSWHDYYEIYDIKNRRTIKFPLSDIYGTIYLENVVWTKNSVSLSDDSYKHVLDISKDSVEIIPIKFFDAILLHWMNEFRIEAKISREAVDEDFLFRLQVMKFELEGGAYVIPVKLIGVEPIEGKIMQKVVTLWPEGAKIHLLFGTGDLDNRCFMAYVYDSKDKMINEELLKCDLAVWRRDEENSLYNERLRRAAGK